MREIKFRKWDEENKEMIDGDCLAFEEYAPLSELLTQDGIMQYTGLKDCKGKEIYEGDIVEGRIDGMGTGHKHPVVWDNNDATYKFGHAMLGGSDVEVIGNIYENPELLEGENG